MKSALLSRSTLILAVVLLTGVGCRKLKHSESGKTVTQIQGETPAPQGGKGGNATLKITPNHDGLIIDSCMVYIKYDASVIPFDNQFDDSAKARIIDGKTYATFSGLKTGNYYIFGRGWDLVRSEKVSGGMPFIITEEHKGTTHSFDLAIMDYE